MFLAFVLELKIVVPLERSWMEMEKLGFSGGGGGGSEVAAAALLLMPGSPPSDSTPPGDDVIVVNYEVVVRSEGYEPRGSLEVE